MESLEQVTRRVRRLSAYVWVLSALCVVQGVVVIAGSLAVRSAINATAAREVAVPPIATDEAATAGPVRPEEPPTGELATQDHEILVARELRFADKDGRVAAVLALRDDGRYLDLRRPNGDLLIGSRLEGGGPEIALYESGQERIALGVSTQGDAALRFDDGQRVQRLKLGQAAEEWGLTLDDDQAVTRSRLGLGPADNGVFLFSAAGQKQVALGVTSEQAGLTLADAAGHPRAQLDLPDSGPALSLFDGEGHSQVALTLQSSDRGLVIQGPTGRVEAGMVVTEAGASLDLFDREQQAGVRLAVESKRRTFDLFDQQGVRRAGIAITEQGPGIELLDASGRRKFKAP